MIIKKFSIWALVALLLVTGAPVTTYAASSVTAQDKAFIADAQQLYYYEGNRQARYLAYHHRYPKNAASSIVWWVNADIDKPAYSAPVTAKQPSSVTVLVNKQHYLSSGFKPAALTSVDSARMLPEAAKAVKTMKSAAAQEGVFIYARTNGYRSYATQRSLNGNTGARLRAPDSSIARAGFSEHQTGLAVDMTPYRGSYANITYNSKEGVWLRNNAWKYGFIVRYTPANKSITEYISEPWHVRYIGPTHSRLMHELGYASYEEYWVKYVAHTPTGWVKANAQWYYFAGGKMRTGWQKAGNAWYYLDAATGVMKSGWQKINTAWYYLSAASDGKMRSGWQEINGKRYYLGSANDGAMKSGWQTIGGEKYYFGGAGDGAMKSGWQTIGGEKYYFGGASDGAMKSGWQTIGGEKYYFGGTSDGAMKSGWQTIDGETYYFDAIGIMATGYREIDGIPYYFDPSSGVNMPVPAEPDSGV